MVLPNRNLFLAAGLALVLPGCATSGTTAAPAAPAGEVQCFVATDPISCKLEHSVAGGEAIQVIGTDP